MLSTQPRQVLPNQAFTQCWTQRTVTGDSGMGKGAEGTEV